MDQREGDIRRDIEDRRAAMTEKVGMVAERAQETMEGVKSTIKRAMAGFKQVQETMEGTTSAADTLIESVKLTVDETAERVNRTADLLYQVRQSPLDHARGCAPVGLYPW
jgi:methyl-accepting chemotaxis protein